MNALRFFCGGMKRFCKRRGRQFLPFIWLRMPVQKFIKRVVEHVEIRIEILVPFMTGVETGKGIDNIRNAINNAWAERKRALRNR